MDGALSPQLRAAITMTASWMGERFYRTFRHGEQPPAPFDAVLEQRERRIGVTAGALWLGDEPVLPGASALASLLTADLEGDAGSYAIWVPPATPLPLDEPARSRLRLLLAKGLGNLQPGERREVRIPVTVKIAKIEAGGAYVSVSGGLSTQWTAMSEGIDGAFHLDARTIHRLPEEQAEIDILISRVRDRAALLAVEELSEIELHDYWLVSRLPAEGPPGVTVIGGPTDADPHDGAVVRRQLRRHVTRAVEQRDEGGCDLAVLVLAGALAHIGDELVTASLRGMNPASYGALDLIVLVADGQVRQVLQPRSLPWESAG